jgi:zinc transport system substrate-binding protein
MILHYCGWRQPRRGKEEETMIEGRRQGLIALLLGASLGAAPAEAASDLKIAATIAPAHSLVAMVAGVLSAPALIVRPGTSPHHYAMKPSAAKALSEADLVFWVGEALEPWMEKALEALAGDAVAVELGAAPGLTRLPLREGGVWAAHDHGGDQGHAAEEHGHADEAHDRALDSHLWLDPDNALVWLDAIADALAAADPANADSYRANAAEAKASLKAMTADIEQTLAPIAHAPYVVFHDAYHYFERRFDLHPVGSISLGDADRPGPGRVRAIRDAIVERSVRCVFAEPQFEPKLIETIVEGTDVKTGELDPLGVGLQPGAELYPTLMRRLADSLAACLG